MLFGEVGPHSWKCAIRSVPSVGTFLLACFFKTDEHPLRERRHHATTDYSW